MAKNTAGKLKIKKQRDQKERISATEQDAAFNRTISGPAYSKSGPDYDRWLFDQGWKAAKERCAELADSMIGADRHEIADAIRKK